MLTRLLVAYAYFADTAGLQAELHQLRIARLFNK